MQFVVSGEKSQTKEFPVVPPGVYNAEVTRAEIRPVNPEFKARNAWMTWDFELNLAFKLEDKAISGGQWFWGRARLLPELKSDDTAVQWISAILGEPTLPTGFVLDEANISSLVGEKVRLRLDSKYNENKQVYENKVADLLPIQPDQGQLTVQGQPPSYTPPAVQSAPAQPAYQPPVVQPAPAQPAYQPPVAAPPTPPSVLDEPF